jgi:6-phosphogluconolactonase
MTSIIVGNEKALAKKAVDIIAASARRLLRKKGFVVLGIPGGRSVKELFRSFRATTKIPWDKVHIFWVDERLVQPSSPQSNCKMAFDLFLEELISKNCIPRANVHPFDVGRGIGSYNKELRKYKGFDIIIVGVGEDCHVAALYPNHHSIKNRSNGYFAIDDSPKPPHQRVTSSRKMLEKADTAIALFLGKRKAGAYKKYRDSSISIGECPAKIINYIRNSYVLTDLE